MNEPLTNIAKTKTPMSVRKAVGLESLAFGAAEGVSMITSLGVIAVADKLIPPEIMKSASHAVAKVCIEPFQDTIEKVLDKCRVHECRVDRSKSREERAAEYARVLTLFGAAFFASMGAKLFTRRHVNELLNVSGEGYKEAGEHLGFFRKKLYEFNPKNWSREELMIFAADEGIHIGLGGMLLFNDKAADVADEQIKHLSNVLQKSGFDKKKADDVSSMAVIWEAPNIAGSLAGLLAIFGKHAYNMPHIDRIKANSIKDILSGAVKSEHAISGH